MKFSVLFLIFGFIIKANALAQETGLSIDVQNRSLNEIFQVIENTSPYRFFYNDNLLKEEINLSIKLDNADINQILSTLLKDVPLSYKVLDKYLVVITPKEEGKKSKITGKVFSSVTIAPLPGVNIIIKDTQKGTVTDINGNFSIYFDENENILTFSYVGFLSKEIKVTSGERLTVFLDEDLANLEEVIVIGYTQMKRRDVTGAITSIPEEEIASAKSSNIIESIQGKASGVDITRVSGQAGTELNITIRGNRSLGQGGATNDPLYIVDGVQYRGSINLNPNDIASMEILKDASSTAIYGVAGANGVILITTKKGKIGKPKVSFNAYYGITSKLGDLPYVDREYYLKKKRDLVRESENENYDLTDEEVDSIGISLLRTETEYFDSGHNFNWIDNYLKQNGKLQDYNLNISGGTERLIYSTSISYFNEQSLIEKDDFSRYTIHLNLESGLNSRLTTGAAFLGSVSKQNKGSNFSSGVIKLTPLVPPTDSEGRFIPYITENRINPFLLQKYTTLIEEESKAYTTFFANINFFNGISFRSSINVQFIYNTDGEAVDKIPDVEGRVAYSDVTTIHDFNLIQNNIISYIKESKSHSFNIIAGIEIQNNEVKMSRIFANNLNVGNDLWYNPTEAQEEIIVQLEDPDALYYSRVNLLSYIGRAYYSFKKKYIVQTSIRYDGASQLSSANKWKPFPTASLAWKISEEELVKKIEQISNLKIRVGAGRVGNNGIPPYSSIPKLNQNPLYIEFGKAEEQVAFGYRPEKLGNEKLTWETTNSYNLGLDFGFLKNRYYGTIELYKSFTESLLQERLFPITSGFPNGWTNVGNVTNKGIELDLHGVLFSKNYFSWRIDMSFSSNDEKITALGEGRTEDLGKGWFEGRPVNVYYDFVFNGIWQENEAELAKIYNESPGDIKLLDRNNDSIISAEHDKDIIGFMNPKWIGGLSTSISYKNLDLTISAIARFGQTIQDQVIHYWSPNGQEGGFALDYWTPKEPNNPMPKVRGKYIDAWPDIDRLLYTDGSYIKIKDITLGYNFPERLLSHANISRMRIYFSLKNYFVFSDFFNKGRYDPEQEGSIVFPIPKLTTIGFNIEL